ncbi:hypothetical protein, partial [Escherichia coli]|uniref:hypothetical protein n=1 Tax=Escherichia coli TaxID=562 RepID=UPI0030C6FE77
SSRGNVFLADGGTVICSLMYINKHVIFLLNRFFKVLVLRISYNKKYFYPYLSTHSYEGKTADIALF